MNQRYLPPHVARHLADLRLTHLKEMKALQSSIRAKALAQKLKSAPTAADASEAECAETAERGAAGGCGATKPVNIDFASHSHVSENEKRQMVERADVFTSLSAWNAAERRAHARAHPVGEANAKAAATLNIRPIPEKKRRATNDAWNKYRLGITRARVEYLKATMNAHAYNPSAFLFYA